MFYAIVLAVAFWLTISLLNILWLQYFPLVWVSRSSFEPVKLTFQVAVILFMYGRWLPLFIVVVVETVQEAKKQALSESSTLIN